MGCCESYFDFHIVTAMGDTLNWYNRVIENGSMFFLCRGNDDPTLFVKPDWVAIGKVATLIVKIVRREAATV